MLTVGLRRRALTDITPVLVNVHVEFDMGRLTNDIDDLSNFKSRYRMC
jgi:hypothetical protein